MKIKMNFLSNLTTIEKAKLLLSGIVGMFICYILLIIVNIIMVETSINIALAANYGILFIGIGLIIVYRIHQLKDNNVIYPFRSQLYIFAIAVVITGISVVYVEGRWFIISCISNDKISVFAKVPFFICESISINFIYTFCLIDCLNSFYTSYYPGQRTLVETPLQIVSVFILSVLLGILYGGLFSIKGIEDIRDYWDQTREMRIEEAMCEPITLVVGFLGGVMNEIIRIEGNLQGFTFQQINDPFKEEI